MALPLFLTTIFSVIFLPIAVYLYRSDTSGKLPYLVYGGATWSIVAIVQFIILNLINLIVPFEIARELSMDTITQVQTEARTILFWYLFFIALIGQILLFLGTERTMDTDTAWDYAIFGLGWGLSEFVHRFLFFGSGNLELQIYLFFYTISVAVAIGSTIIRTAENTKFIMFASFLKFFSEMAVFGGLGYDGVGSLTDIIWVNILLLVMAGLSMLTRKYPLKD